MAKNKYTEKFETFWDAYPRKTAKHTAFKSWQKLGVDDDAFLPTQIIQDIEKRTRMKFWPRDKTKVPHAATWINQMRWEDTGWETEIETRKEDPVVKHREYKPVEDTGPHLSEWERLLNRLWMLYVRHARGMMPEQVTQSIRIKHATLKECESAIVEELEADPTKRGEMADMIGRLFLKRLDLGLQLHISDKVIVT